MQTLAIGAQTTLYCCRGKCLLPSRRDDDLYDRNEGAHRSRLARSLAETVNAPPVVCDGACAFAMIVRIKDPSIWLHVIRHAVAMARLIVVPPPVHVRQVEGPNGAHHAGRNSWRALASRRIGSECSLDHIAENLQHFPACGRLNSFSNRATYLKRCSRDSKRSPVSASRSCPLSSHAAAQN